MARASEEDCNVEASVCRRDGHLCERSSAKRPRTEGQTHLSRSSTLANKYTLHVFATKTGVAYWELCEKNADTEEVERIAAAAAERMKTDDVLIWDRLGRSGRAANPTAQHYSPVAIAAFRGRGVHVRYLPPKGKYFNPVELLFADLKTHYIRPAYPVHGGKMSFDAIHAIVEQYMRERAPATLPGFFKARANGANAIEDKLL